MRKLIDIKMTSIWDCDTDARIIRIMVITADESDIKDLPDNHIEVQGAAIKEQFVSVKMLDGVDRVAQALRALADRLNPTSDKLSPVGLD
jgi:hypothetical protein